MVVDGATARDPESVGRVVADCLRAPSRWPSDLGTRSRRSSNGISGISGSVSARIAVCAMELGAASGRGPYSPRAVRRAWASTSMRCDDCGHQRVSYNSCRNRHCPKSSGHRSGGLARSTPGRRVARALRARDLHDASDTGAARASEPEPRLRAPARQLGPDPSGERPSPVASRRHPLLRRHPRHLGPDAHSTSARTLCGAGGWTERGRTLLA